MENQNVTPRNEKLFPAVLRQWDPEFVETWMEPYYLGRSIFELDDDADLSELDRVELSSLETLEKRHSFNRSMVAFFDDLRKIRPLSDREKQELFPLIAKGDKGAYNRVMEAHLFLVFSLADRYADRHMEYLDIAEAGLYALQGAIETYTVRPDRTFHAYAVWHIRKSMLCALWRYWPDNLQRRSSIDVIRRCGQQLEKTLGRKPTAAEIAEKTGINLEDVEKKLKTLEMIPEQKKGEKGAKLSVVYRTLRDKRPELFAEVIEMMTPREANVLEVRFRGVGEVCSRAKVADQFGVSEERIRMIENKLIRKLCHPGRLDQIDPGLFSEV